MNAQTKGLGSVEAAEEILKAAHDEGITLRLIGGLAIRFHCHGEHSTHLRAYNDIDLFGLGKESRRISSVLRKLNYSPNDVYNALYGRARLQFIDHETHRDVEVFLDRFMMDHTLDFRERLQLDPLTIPVSDLLLTKLQIVRLNAKDVKDIVALLEDHHIGYVDGQETLNVNRIAQASARDWGLYKTLSDNIETMMKRMRDETFTSLEKDDLTEKLRTIQRQMEKQRKTFTWRLRNLLGGRIAWYDQVEMGEGEAR